MNNYYKKVILILLVLVLFGVLVVFVFDADCLFKKIIHLACPGCGLTRGFKCLLNLDIKGAFYYNILTIPIFLFIIILIVLIVIDMIKKTKYLTKCLNLFVKYYYIIIILLIIGMIINNIRGI